MKIAEKSADNALKALQHYLKHNDDLESSIRDLMTDLKYLCRKEILDYKRIAADSELQYNFETKIYGGGK